MKKTEKKRGRPPLSPERVLSEYVFIRYTETVAKRLELARVRHGLETKASVGLLALETGLDTLESLPHESANPNS